MVPVEFIYERLTKDGIEKLDKQKIEECLNLKDKIELVLNCSVLKLVDSFSSYPQQDKYL